MLFRLLKNAKNLVSNFFLNNDLADKEAKLYFKDKDESN
jgi:hypothetical protein